MYKGFPSDVLLNPLKTNQVLKKKTEPLADHRYRGRHNIWQNGPKRFLTNIDIPELS